jgi:hypothetical protein
LASIRPSICRGSALGFSTGAIGFDSRRSDERRLAARRAPAAIYRWVYPGDIKLASMLARKGDNACNRPGVRPVPPDAASCRSSSSGNCSKAGMFPGVKVTLGSPHPRCGNSAHPTLDAVMM